MSDGSKIEWTEATWPVTVGCDHISAGCDHCYAATLTSGRLSHQPVYAGLAENGRFNGTVRCLPERLDWPLKWRKPRRIFVCSMSDLFHEAVPDEFIARVFAVMASAQRHTFQVLSKRHGRMRSLLSNPDFPLSVLDAMAPLGAGSAVIDAFAWPLPNAWIGVSAEDQRWAEIRIPALLATPAAIRFMSAEPLLGPVNLIGQGGNLVGAGMYALPDAPEYDDGEPVCQDHGVERCDQGCTFLDWVIVGGESGRGARPMHPDWARSLRDQCQSARTPFLFKQWGSHRWVAGSRWDEPTQCWADDGIEPQRVSKKLAGRELDGRTWDEYPRVYRAVPS